MSLSIERMGDLIVATNPDFGKKTWTSLVHDLQSFIALPKIFREGVVKQRGGKHIEFRIVTDHNASFRGVGLFAEDQMNRTDKIRKGSIPWQHFTWNYQYDLREIDLQAGDAEIIDIIKVERNSSWDAAAIGLEEQLWSAPASSTTENEILGLPFWIQKTTSEGFNGGDPSGFSAGAANIPVATVPRWQNYGGQYTDKSRDDLVEMMKTAAYKTAFKAPVPFPKNKRDADSLGIYNTQDTTAAMDKVAEQQNDSLGHSLGGYRGIFNGRPYTSVPYLDQNDGTTASDPVYMINWKFIAPYVLRNWHMTEDKPDKAPMQHTVVVVHVDFTTQIGCWNRRAQTVLVGPNHS